MILSIKQCYLRVFLAIALSSAMGCSLGTEVGNGVKPKPTPEPKTAANETQEDMANSPKDSKGTTTAGSPNSSTDEGTMGSSKKSILTNEVVQQLILNTCASPWSESNLQKPVSLKTVANTQGLPQMRFSVKSGGLSNQSLLEWGDPATNRFIINPIQGTDSQKVSIKDAATNLPALPGSTVICNKLSKQSGQLLGAEMGNLEGTVAELVLEGKGYNLSWYYKNTATSKQLVMIRIINHSEALILDFKPY